MEQSTILVKEARDTLGREKGVKLANHSPKDLNALKGGSGSACKYLIFKFIIACY